MEQVQVVVPTTDALWAHPIAVLALPAFLPVLVIVGTILWIARNDRRAEAAEAALEGADGPAALPEASGVLLAAAPTESSAGEASMGGSSSVGEPLQPNGAAAETDAPAEEVGAPRRPWRDRLPRLVIGDED